MPESFRTLLANIKTGDWLTRSRVFAYCGILLGFELQAFFYLVAATHGWIFPLKQPVVADFVGFYAAGRLALLGTPAHVYAQHLLYLAEQRATEPGIPDSLFFYPPVFIMLCVIFAGLPYFLALIVFEGVTLLGCLLVLKRIVRRAGDPNGLVLLLPLLAFPAMLINFGVGQNGFLTAALFGAATLLIDRRPTVAGILFGALCYKPHFGLLIPVALAAGRRWRAFAAAAVCVAALGVASLVWFGGETWRAFWQAFRDSHLIYEAGEVDFGGYVSTFGAMRLLGAGTMSAYAAQAVASLVAAAAVAWVWGQNLSLATRAATLAAATLVAVPLALYYDLVLAAIAIAWLVRAGRADGFLAWEKSLLAGIYAAPAVVRSLALGLHWPAGVLLTWLLLALCAARARHESGAANRHPAR